MLQFYLLPRMLSAFQQERCGALPRSVLLSRTAVFSHEEDNGFQAAPRTGRPWGQDGHGSEQPTG
jgi:hypothetical protein